MSTLLPTGYEDFLRAVGHRLDLRQAAAITVAELDGLVAVGGVGRLDGAARGEVAPFQDLLRPEDVADLLDEAFRRRAPARTAALASVSG